MPALIDFHADARAIVIDLDTKPAPRDATLRRRYRMIPSHDLPGAYWVPRVPGRRPRVVTRARQRYALLASVINGSPSPAWHFYLLDWHPRDTATIRAAYAGAADTLEQCRAFPATAARPYARIAVCRHLDRARGRSGPLIAGMAVHVWSAPVEEPRQSP